MGHTANIHEVRNLLGIILVSIISILSAICSASLFISILYEHDSPQYLNYKIKSDYIEVDFDDEDVDVGF